MSPRPRIPRPPPRARSCATGRSGTTSRIFSISAQTVSATPSFRKKALSAPATPSSWATPTPAPTGPSVPLPPASAPPTWRSASYKGVCAFRAPKTMKIVITGDSAAGRVAPRTSSSPSSRELTVNGATDKVIEFVGPVVDAMNMSARMTLCNMAVEAGRHLRHLPARPGDRRISLALHPGRLSGSIEAAVADFARWHSDPDARYARDPRTWMSPTSPPRSPSASSPTRSRTSARWPAPRSIRSISAPAPTAASRICATPHSILKGRKLADGRARHRHPGHAEDLFSQALDEGLIKIFMDAGFCVLNPTCGACLGMSSAASWPKVRSAPQPPTATSTAAWAKAAWST